MKKRRNQFSSVRPYKNGKPHGHWVEIFRHSGTHFEGGYDMGVRVGLWDKYYYYGDSNNQRIFYVI